jgi:hypothetical protein
MSSELIVELTQSILAILAVLGGGIAALTGSPHTLEIMPFAALIFGYYFGKTVEKAKLNGKSGDPNG